MSKSSNLSKRLKMDCANNTLNGDGAGVTLLEDVSSSNERDCDDHDQEKDCQPARKDDECRRSKTTFIAVHLGAGEHPEKRSLEYKKLCEEACGKAMKLLKNGKSAGDAVVEAIKILEDSRLVNAGSGSNLTIDGTVECDAGYMDGEGYFGGVGAVPGVPNPILVAKSLADTHRKEKLFSCGRIPPTFLVGQCAKTYAASNGVGICDDEDMISVKAKQTHDKYINKLQPVQNSVNDTVGAVALDGHGNVASGVSSGGHWLKFPGRIGHSPLFGCGCFSSNSSSEDRGAVSVSVSGSGEMLSRVRLAEKCGLDSIKRYGSSTIRETILEHVVDNESLNIHSEPRYAGVIALYWDGRHGEFSYAHSSKNFVLGSLKSSKSGRTSSSFHFSVLKQGQEPGKCVSTGGSSF